MLHARIAAAFTHSFVKEIVGSGSTECRHVAGAEAPDCFGNELEFRDRDKIKPAQLFFATLRLGVESADRLQCVAKKIEPHRHVHAGRIKIENAATYCIIARLTHGRGADETIELQPFDYTLHANDIAGRNRKSMSSHESARGRALERSVHRRQEN